MTQETKKPRRSSLRRQRMALLFAAIAVVILAVSFALVWYFTSRIIFTDMDGAKTRYYVVKQDGVYVMRDADKNVLDTNEEGNYITAAGTLVAVDPDTGETTIVAVVVTSGSETLRFDASSRSYDILMYPQLQRSGSDPSRVIYSITVHNETGEITFYRDENDVYVLDGHTRTPYSSVMFSTLVVCAGYTNVLDRLPREAVEQYGFGEYGLPDDPADATVWFTITAMDDTEYTVLIGDEIPSGAGYYARNAATDDVYILKEMSASSGLYASFSQVMFGAVEDYVTPTVTPKMELTSYFDVTDFTMYKAPEITGNESDLSEFSTIISFSYIPIELRRGTFAANTPYVGNGAVEGFAVNSFRVDDCLQNLQYLTPLRTVKLVDSGYDAVTFAEEYGVSHAIEFVYNVSRSSDASTDYEVESYYYILIWVSPMTDHGTYYLYNEEYEMVIEADRGNLEFLEWTPYEWIETDIFSGHIAYCTELTIEINNPIFLGAAGRHTVTFILDNSASTGTTSTGSIDTSALKVFARVSDGNGTETVPVDTAQFKAFYQMLLFSSLIGNADLSDEEMDGYRASGAAGADVVIRVTYEAETGTVEREYCFYSYDSAMKMFTTLNGKGSFYSWRSHLEKIVADLDRVFSGETIESK